MSKDSLGELEELVLLAIIRAGPDAYGLSITEELRRTAGRRVSRATVYVLLRRLEQAGLIARMAEGDGRGVPRRPVQVTSAGLILLARVREMRLRMWSGIERALEDA